MGHDQLDSSMIQSPADLVSHWLSIIWALTRENLSSRVCEQQRHRPTCASTHSVQHLCVSLIGKYIKTCYKEISLF